MEQSELEDFGERYTEAWNSKNPPSVAEFFTAYGSLKVNDNSPAVGREAIAKVAEGFMTAFPDMVLTMDSLIITSDGVEYHWTFAGTNSGPDGTGNKVRFSGFELWQINDEGLVGRSIGTFDEEEYNRQLQGGLE